MMQAASGRDARGGLAGSGTDTFDVGSGASGSALEPAPPAQVHSDLTSGEWDILFDAVRIRLERAATAWPDLVIDDGARQVGIALVECAEALGRLQTLRLEQGEHGRQLERQERDFRSAQAGAGNARVDTALQTALADLSARTTSGL